MILVNRELLLLAYILVDIGSGSLLIGLIKVSNKTVRIAEIPFLPFKIL